MRRLRWVFGGLDPVPRDYAHLAADFDRENREILRSIGIPLSLCAGLLYLAVTPIAAVMEPHIRAAVVPLHGVMILVALTISWLLHRRTSMRAVYLLAIVLGLTIGVISTALVVLTGQSSRNTTHLFAIIVICLLPAPPRWMAGFVAASLAVAAVAAAWLTSAGEPQLMVNLLVRVITTLIAFGIVYGYLSRQRWESFLARHRLAAANSQLTTLTDRLRRELALAHEIQQRLLPAAAPACPGLDIAGVSRPALELGGDFYAYAAFADDHLAIAVGDVSGKGLPAALLMATSVALLEATLDRPWSPAALLARLSQALAPQMQATRQNCAVCYADLRAGEVRVANAGG
ncbi:MAG TPA: SpoIIE family protein phosphatase, partial [Herpetosiphonaceae bacterium]